MGDLTPLLRQKWRWACERPYFWASLCLAGMTASVIIIWPGPIVQGVPSDTRLRVWVMALQMIGAWTVWSDLTRTASSHGHKGIIRGTFDWLKAGLFGRRQTISLSSAIAVALGGSARIRVRRETDPSSSLPLRVENAEFNLAKIDEELDSVFREIGRSAADTEAKIRREAQTREEAVATLATRIDDLATGNFPTLVFGAAWLTVGTVISAIAPEIARLVAHQWVAVWNGL